MNCVSGGRAKLLARFIVYKECVRTTNKTAVELDANLLSKVENNEVKPRHHPGIVKSTVAALPANISKALQCVVGDHPIKTLLQDCKRLNYYIASRHPPIEENEFQLKVARIAEQVDGQMPPEKLALLSEEEQTKWRVRREQMVRRRLGERTYAWKPITYGAYESLVYAVGRGALEYGVLMRILREIQTRDADFKPRSYFDFGSGVGTGMWAASSLWQDSIYEYFNVDSSRNMNELSELILRDGHENQQMQLRNVFYRQFLPGLETKYDLVVAAYTLFELPSAQSRRDAIMNLWRKCDGYLVIVEEGSRRGFELVNNAREFVLSLQEPDLRGSVFAPCAHNEACPRLSNSDDRTPCNFETLYTPLDFSRKSESHSNARYSYVVLKKGDLPDPTTRWPRLVRPTLVRSKHTICRMCTSAGKLEEIIFTQSKHGRAAYRCARASRWGDRLPVVLGGFVSEKPAPAKTADEKEVESSVERDLDEDKY